MSISDKLKLYANAIVETTRQPLLLLDGNLRVQFASPAFLEYFTMSPKETQGQLVYELGHGPWNIEELRTLLAEILPERKEVTGCEIEHDFPALGKRKMLLHARPMEMDKQPDMILLMVEDITEHKRLEEEMAGQKEFAEKVIDAVREPLLVMDWNLRVQSANESFYETFQAAPDEIEGRLVYELGNGQWDIPRLRELLENVLLEDDAFDDYEVEHYFPELGRRTLQLNARRIDRLMRILLVIEDVTEKRMVERRRQFVIDLNDTIRTLDDPLEVAKCVTAGVAEHLGISQAAYATVDEQSGTVTIMHRYWQRTDIYRDEYALGEFGPQVLQELRSGQSLVACDIGQDPRMADHREIFAAIEARAMVCVPVVKEGQLRAVFTVSHRAPRSWSDQEVELIEQLAERTRSSVEQAEARQQIRESEARLQNAFKIATVGIIYWDADMRISQANEAFLKMTGYNHDEVVGLSWQELTPQEFHPVSERAVEELNRIGEITPYEKQYYRRDGSHWWGVFAACKMDGDAAVEFVLDVTERKQSEKALRESEERLRHLNESLEVRVAERTAELQEREQRLRALAMELSRAEQQERTRLAQILHDDVQQLLVAVQMRLAFLSDEAVSDRAREDLRRTEEILSQTQQALRSLSVELAPPVLQERGLGPGLEWLAKRMQDHHGLEVEIIADPAAEEGAEPFYDLLFQVVRELLLNVVKHAGTNRASVRFEHRDSHIHLEVQDMGRGCNLLDVEKHAGQSFGLFHTRERLRHVGGELMLESSPGEGTRVTISVPLVKSPEQTAGSSQDEAGFNRSRGTGRRVHVLLVDDHQTVREGLARLLEREPELKIIGQADDGRQAVTLARELKPDIIVMDVSMPGMNGIEATRRIKRELPDVRVIGLSLHAEEDMAQAMLDAGAERYLTKGGPSADLTAAIRSLRNKV